MKKINFGDVLEAAEQLSDEEREELIKDVRKSEREFAEGKCQPVTLDELMKEILL